jgi:hypothetical protein
LGGIGIGVGIGKNIPTAKSVYNLNSKLQIDSRDSHVVAMKCLIDLPFLMHIEIYEGVTAGVLGIVEPELDSKDLKIELSQSEILCTDSTALFDTPVRAVAQQTVEQSPPLLDHWHFHFHVLLNVCGPKTFQQNGRRKYHKRPLALPYQRGRCLCRLKDAN